MPDVAVTQCVGDNVDNNGYLLKQGRSLLIFASSGDIGPTDAGRQGLYYADTRFLSLLALRLGRHQPVLLDATLGERDQLFTAHLTNPELQTETVNATGERVQAVLPAHSLHLVRTRLLWQAVWYEAVTVTNYQAQPCVVPLTLHFAADFADIFEVRGYRRTRRGHSVAPQVDRDRVVLGYQGLDQVERYTELRFEPAPRSLAGAEAYWQFTLAAHASVTLLVTTICKTTTRKPAVFSYATAWEGVRSQSGVSAADWSVRVAHPGLNAWLARSASDLQLLLTERDGILYPDAGIPWFCTPFGRDGIITALATLWYNPHIAQGVLRYLAATQATAVIPAQEAEPGKIVHETREGEMAATGAVPFGRYYGSVDATPLFVMLAGAYYQQTGDQALIATLWPHIERALGWIDTYGDRDGDGFVEYVPQAPPALRHQGWKDSGHAVFHADGRPAEGAIALCEVQGYVYAAKRAVAAMATALDKPELATRLRAAAAVLQARFEDAFWCEELGMYALALDGNKQPCRVRSSNAGHCLFAGIAHPERARRVAETLLSADCFSGWGIRTIAAATRGYNPMSYHNGSVWPHDNALIAAGMSRYGLVDMAQQVFAGMLALSCQMAGYRLPELICGFARAGDAGPVRYPTACAPQAWAAAAVFLLVQAALGLTVQTEPPRIKITATELPPCLQGVEIRENLQEPRTQN